MTTTLQTALTLAERGWKVFPCNTAKAPLTPRGLYDGTSDPETIATWWSVDHPGAQIGVWAGGSGLVCLDLDVKNGRDGIAAVNAENLPWSTPMTYTTISGSGRHAVFAESDREATPSVNYRGLPGVDVRAGNSYFIFTGQIPEAPLTLCPEWLCDERPQRAADAPFSESETEWFDLCPDGVESDIVRRTVDRLTPGQIGHDAMRNTLAALVRYAPEGHAGVPSAIKRLRDLYVSGEWEAPRWARDFDAALAGAISKFGGFPTVTPAEMPEPEPPADDDLYVDVAQVLAGNLSAPKPSLAIRTDGRYLLYDRAVNVLFGDPESGKTIIATSVAADAIIAGQAVLWLDLDHNGATATIARLRDFGVSADLLRDRDVFRLAEPDTPADVEAIVAEAADWEPSVAVVDSIGELMGLYGCDSNNADDFTRVNRATMAQLAKSMAVVAIDHAAKGTASREYGASGTMAKKRAVDGLYARVTVLKPFARGAGGLATLNVVKDRHGGVREHLSNAVKEPMAATFELSALPGGGSYWRFVAPNTATEDEPQYNDLDALLAMNPAPTSIKDVMRRAGWGGPRATAAYKLFQNSAGDQFQQAA